MKSKEQKRREAQERQARHDAKVREDEAEFESLHFRSFEQLPCCMSCKRLQRGLEDWWCGLLFGIGRPEEACSVSYATVCDKYERRTP